LRPSGLARLTPAAFDMPSPWHLFFPCEWIRFVSGSISLREGAVIRQQVSYFLKADKDQEF
jgi:hypothetical protein